MGRFQGDDGRRDSGDHLPVPFDPAASGEPTELEQALSISRRRFLTLLAAAGAVAAADPSLSRGQAIRQARRALAAMAEAPAQAQGAADLFIQVERDLDLVTLDFEFFGFSVRPGSPPAIVPDGEDARIVVHFPPQAIGEAVYFETHDNKLCVDPAPILSDLAGPSRLVFSLPPGATIPLDTMSVADLLDWSGWRLEVPPVATAANIAGTAGPFAPRQPGATETLIECPYALYLSPTDGAVFFARPEPLTATATECWGATLAGPDRRVVASYARDVTGDRDATPYTRIRYFDNDPP